MEYIQNWRQKVYAYWIYWQKQDHWGLSENDPFDHWKNNK